MSLSHGLLGLLNYAPMSGYDLKKLFEESINFFWSAQTSQIYRELKSLEAAGHVQSSVEPSHSGPNKRVYRITESGRRRLKEWLVNVSDEIGEDNRNEFLLRIFLSSNMGIDALQRILEARLAKYRRDIQRLESLGAVVEKYRDKFDVDAQMPFWSIAISRGFHDVGSHIHWAEESLKAIQARKEGEA